MDGFSSSQDEVGRSKAWLWLMANLTTQKIIIQIADY